MGQLTNVGSGNPIPLQNPPVHHEQVVQHVAPVQKPVNTFQPLPLDTALVTQQNLTGEHVPEQIGHVAEEVGQVALVEQAHNPELMDRIKNMTGDDWKDFSKLSFLYKRSDALKEVDSAFETWTGVKDLGNDKLVDLQRKHVALQNLMGKIQAWEDTKDTHPDGSINSKRSEKLQALKAFVQQELGPVQEQILAKQNALLTQVNTGITAWNEIKDLDNSSLNNVTEKSQALKTLLRQINAFEAGIPEDAQAGHEKLQQLREMRTAIQGELEELKGKTIEFIVGDNKIQEGDTQEVKQQKAQAIFARFKAFGNDNIKYQLSSPGRDTDLLAGDTIGACASIAVAFSACLRDAGFNVTSLYHKMNVGAFLTTPLDGDFIDQTAVGNVKTTDGQFTDTKRYLFTQHYITKVEGIGFFCPTTGKFSVDEQGMQDLLVGTVLQNRANIDFSTPDNSVTIVQGGLSEETRGGYYTMTGHLN